MSCSRMRTVRSMICAATVGAAMALTTGCQTGPKTEGPVRAVWVTRFDYKTADDVTRIIDNCGDAGFNMVVFQVRGNATAFYPSKLEPWAEQFDFKDPGFDPLQTALDRARQRDMELHAWVNVMPAWRGTSPPSDPNQLYNARPEWFWYDQHGNRQALSSFYVSLNPCLPEVREYLVDVFEEIVANYDIDGLHMDYIRFPNEPPAIPRGSGLDYPRDERTLALYKEQTGLTPDENQEAWNQWRTDQVTQLVADIKDMTRKTRPRACLAASVGSDPQGSLRYFRDEMTWIERRLIDQAYPMNYQDDLDRFKQGLEAWLPPDENVVVVPGMWFSPRLSAERSPEVARQQIEYAIQTTGNVCVFSYAALFDSRDRGDVNPVSENESRGAQLRQQRRAAVLPLITAAVQ